MEDTKWRPTVIKKSLNEFLMTFLNVAIKTDYKLTAQPNILNYQRALYGED